jgi:hypothetical protein
MAMQNLCFGAAQKLCGLLQMDTHFVSFCETQQMAMGQIEKLGVLLQTCTKMVQICVNSTVW